AVFVQQLQMFETFHHGLHRDRRFESRELRTETEMHARAERHDLVEFAAWPMQIEFLWPREYAFIAVGRSGENQNARPFGNVHSADGGIDQRVPEQNLHRR